MHQQSVAQIKKTTTTTIQHYPLELKLTAYCSKCNAHNCKSLYPIIRSLNNDNPSIVVEWSNAGVWCCAYCIRKKCLQVETSNEANQALEWISAIKSKTVYYYEFATTRHFSIGEEKNKTWILDQKGKVSLKNVLNIIHNPVYRWTNSCRCSFNNNFKI